MKKIICFFLTTVMMLSILIACTDNSLIIPSDTETNKNDDTHSTTDVLENSDTIQTDNYGQTIIETSVPFDYLDFENCTIGIAARPETRYRREFSVEKQADPVDQKIFKRNGKIEKLINIKLEFVEASEFWTEDGIVQFVTTEHQSGVNSNVDIVAPYAAYAITASLRGYYVNLASDDMMYLDITKSYWNQTYVNSALCFGQLYYIVGDLNLTVYDKAIACFANMDLATENSINPDDIYAAIENKEWNYDYFYNIINNFSYLDNNENNVVDAKDTVPITTIWASEGCDGFSHAWEMQFLKTNDDGTHTLTVDGNSKLDQGVEKMKEMYSVEGALLLEGVAPSFTDCFLPGNALFDIDIIYRNADFNNRLRNVQFSYAVLPLPMYDNNQTEYHTTSQDAYNAMSVMTHHPEKYDAISATLELLSAKSYEDVRPFYIEKIVKATYVSGAKPVKMLEIALDGVTFDTATIYFSQVAGVSFDLWRNVIGNNLTVSEKWAITRTITENKVQDFDSWFMAAMD